MFLPDEIICYIFTFLQPNINYFLIYKRIYELRKRYLSSFLTVKNFKPDRQYWLLTLLMNNKTKLDKDMGRYRKHILYFILNNNKKSFIYPCRNSYHRMLVHEFCETQELSHETIIHGYKMVRGCCNCYSSNISIEKDHYSEYTCICKNCAYMSMGYSAPKWFVTRVAADLKAIKITKK